MEYFLSQIQMILPVLGFNFAVPIPSLKQQTEDTVAQMESPIFSTTYGGVKAFAQEIGNEFVVFQGSTSRKRVTRTIADNYIQIRNKLVKDGKLVESDHEHYWVFAQNIPFTSPSTAANVVCGAQLNGRTTWKIKDSQTTYAEWLESQTA